MALLLNELFLAGGSVVLIVVYYLLLWRRSRSQPLATAQGRHRVARAAWIDLIAGGGAHELLAVQTLRNWIMSSTFLASTAILFAIGLLGIVSTSEKVTTLSNALNFLGSTDRGLSMFKILLMTGDLLFAFFSFSLSVRSFIHCGFMINVPDQKETGYSRELTARELERGAHHYTMGMRAYYLLVPLAFWLFGPAWMLASTAVLIFALRRVD